MSRHGDERIIKPCRHEFTDRSVAQVASRSTGNLTCPSENK